MELEIIINPKVNDDGQAVVQLETAAGAAIKHFRNAHGINVPRARFLPVKSCSDLLLIKSDIYSIQHGQLLMNEARMFDNVPVIKLSDHFKKVRPHSRRLLRGQDTDFAPCVIRSRTSRSGSRRSPRSSSSTISRSLATFTSAGTSRCAGPSSVCSTHLSCMTCELTLTSSRRQRGPAD